MYAIGALLALIGILLRVQLPESPRWLITRGRIDEADRVVTEMERHATRRTTLPPPAAEIPVQVESEKMSYAEIFSNGLYLRRTILLLFVWLIGYITVYAIAAGLTSLLAGLKYPPPEAGLIAAIGTLGFILCAIVAYAIGENMERKYWLPISAVLTLIGGIMIALSGTGNFAVAAIGSIILFFGFNLWVPMSYTWSTRIIPPAPAPPASRWLMVSGMSAVASASWSSRRSSPSSVP